LSDEPIPDDAIARMLDAALLPDVSDELEPYLSNQIGGQPSVLHEMLSQFVHLDVLVYAPTRQADCWTFVTSGTSSKPMPVDDVPEPENYQYCELVLRLPTDWFGVASDGIGMADFDQRNYDKTWPIDVLKYVARMPHQHGFWIGPGHSFPNGDPPDPYHPSLPFAGLILEAVDGWPDRNAILRTTDGKSINLLALTFVYAEEMALKLKHGADALRAKLARIGATQVLDVKRPSAVRKGWFW
jgi:hypothetical protein